MAGVLLAQIDPLDQFLALKVGVTRSGDPENPNSPAFQGAPYDTVFPSRAEGGLTREQANHCRRQRDDLPPRSGGGIGACRDGNRRGT